MGHFRWWGVSMDMGSSPPNHLNRRIMNFYWLNIVFALLSFPGSSGDPEAKVQLGVEGRQHCRRSSAANGVQVCERGRPVPGGEDPAQPTGGRYRCRIWIGLSAIFRWTIPLGGPVRSRQVGGQDANVRWLVRSSLPARADTCGHGQGPHEEVLPLELSMNRYRNRFIELVFPKTKYFFKSISKWRKKKQKDHSR